MIPENYKELINKLVQATRDKKISWDNTSRNSEYKSMIGESMVTTDRWDGVDGIGYVDFAIWNSNGVQVDSVDAAENTPEYTFIMQLYYVAKASYLKADETIADILDHLK